MAKKKPMIAVLVAAFGLMIVAGLQLSIYNLDHYPLVRWRAERMVRAEIKALSSGSEAQRIWAASRLGPMGMGRDDARQALRRALMDGSRAVVANAQLSLKFHLHEPIAVDRETFRLAASGPPDPIYDVASNSPIH